MTTSDSPRPLGDDLLVLDGVSAFYGRVQALNAIELRVAAGSIVTLLGANGAGKSTTLRAITGLVRTTGEITFAGEPITGRSTQHVTKRGIVHVPEGRGSFMKFTVEENLHVGAFPAAKQPGGLRTGLDRVYEYFPVLYERRSQRAGSLSGGEQQVLAIGRGLMGLPRLLLVDELSLGLAPKITFQIFQVLRRLNREEGLTVLLVEQNAALALRGSDYAYVLRLGTVALEGESSALANDDAVHANYLG